MLKLIIEVEAKTQDGLETSVEEALRIIKRGNRGGGDSNDDESYDFNITGEEESNQVELQKIDNLFFLKYNDGAIVGKEFKTKKAAQKYADDEDLIVVQEF